LFAELLHRDLAHRIPPRWCRLPGPEPASYPSPPLVGAAPSARREWIASAAGFGLERPLGSVGASFDAEATHRARFVDPRPSGGEATVSTVDRAGLNRLMEREQKRFVDQHPRSGELYRRAKTSMLAGVPMNWM